MAKDQASREWPAVGYEEQPWVQRYDQPLSHNQRRRHSGPYQAAITREIADLNPIVPSSVLAESDDALRELSLFESDTIPMALGHDNGEIAPLASVLLRTESASSSQIENLTASARQLAADMIGESNSPNARLVNANVRAMKEALAVHDAVSEGTILAMHRALLHGSDPDHAGRWRTEPVWIGGSIAGPHQASFVPPHHDRVPAAVADLLRFANRTDLPYLTQAALAHAQFETIHPFTDGNGRTGRALVAAILRTKGLLRRITVPISAGLLSETRRYFDALGAFRNGDIVPIITAFNQAVFSAASNGTILVRELGALQTRWREAIKARSDAAVWRLLDQLPAQPVVTANSVAGMLDISDRAAQGAIDQLAALEILSQSSRGRRNRVWHSSAILTALDAFGARARRRLP